MVIPVSICLAIASAVGVLNYIEHSKNMENVLGNANSAQTKRKVGQLKQ